MTAVVEVPVPQVGAPAAPTPLEPPAYVGRRRGRRRSTSLVVRASVPVGLLALWWWASATGHLSPDVLASPGKVVTALQELQETGQLREFVTASAMRILIGVGFGVGVGVVLGVVAGLSRLGEELVDPTMQMARAVPFLALTPLFISWFGIDETFKYLLIAVAAAMPMYAYTYLGVRNVDARVVEAARTFGLRGVRLVTEVVLPSALPNIFMALRISLAVSIGALIAAEQIGTEKGIGYLVLLAKQYFRTDYMVLCILLYATLGIAFDVVIRIAERLTMPWQR